LPIRKLWLATTVEGFDLDESSIVAARERHRGW
jgi:hypothetical protein